MSKPQIEALKQIFGGGNAEDKIIEMFTAGIIQILASVEFVSLEFDGKTMPDGTKTKMKRYYFERKAVPEKKENTKPPKSHETDKRYH